MGVYEGKDVALKSINTRGESSPNLVFQIHKDYMGRTTRLGVRRGSLG